MSQPQSPPTVTRTVQLAAAAVPPGGLVISFLGNQLTYCSIICPLLVDTAVTAAGTTLRTPVTFLTSLKSGNVWKTIGITAASVTGPTNDVAQATILADGTRVAPRALNAFEVAVVGGLDILAAAPDGLPAVAEAIATAREQTFTALHLPIVPNPAPTVMPQGVLQVAVVGVINVVGAVIFPAFNEILSAVFDTPNAVAQELAATGRPARALAAGVRTAAGHLAAAGTVIAASAVTAAHDVKTAIEQRRSSRAGMATQRPVSAASGPAASSAPKPLSDRPFRRSAKRDDRSDADSTTAHSVGQDSSTASKRPRAHGDSVRAARRHAVRG
ncbi:hypothetical protein [Mycolicibacterium chubuense]|nr:hypothetical protein [Mycolicibacterium chubuense]